MPPKQNLNTGPSKFLLRRRNVWLRRAVIDSQNTEPSEDEATYLMRVEGILFLAKEPLPDRKIAQLANVKHSREIRTVIGKLNDQYDSRGQSFRIEQIAGGYRLMTKHPYSSWIRRLESALPPVRFSRPLIETLSVIAYRQPVMRAEIEAVRGVGCGEIIRQLMERGFVRISGRSNDLGRPFLYSTSKVFLETFGLNSLDELPHINLPAIAEDKSTVSFDAHAPDPDDADTAEESTIEQAA